MTSVSLLNNFITKTKLLAARMKKRNVVEICRLQHPISTSNLADKSLAVQSILCVGYLKIVKSVE